MQHHLRFTAFTLNLSTFVCLILYMQRRLTTRCLFFGLLINALTLTHTHTLIHIQGKIAFVIVCIARFLRQCAMKIRHICSRYCFCCHFGCCYTILMQAAIFIFTTTYSSSHSLSLCLSHMLSTALCSVTLALLPRFLVLKFACLGSVWLFGVLHVLHVFHAFTVNSLCSLAYV